MSKILHRLDFKSFRTRLLVFLLALLIPVLLGIYLFVNIQNNDYTEETINSYLDLGADVFDFSREEHKNTLLTITSTLTRDWGFRNAFGTGDPYTIIDAADNLLMRSLGAADMMLITEMDGTVIIDTAIQGFDNLQGEWLELMEAAANSTEGIADAIITVDDIPYQMTVIPLFLPTPVAWIFGGFPLDNQFAETVKQSIVSDVSIVRITTGAPRIAPDGRQREAREIVASTLTDVDQYMLLNQLQLPNATISESTATDFTNRTQRIGMLEGEYGTLVRQLYGQPGDDLQIVAVIQKSYRENEENLIELQRRLLQFYLVVIAASLGVVVLLARSVTEPILNLVQRVNLIEQGDYDQVVQVRGRDEIAQLAGSVNNMARGLAEKEKVRDLLGKVVSPEIAEELLSKNIELGGEEKVITILFADIKGFTALCETRQPSEVLTLLNSYLSKITQAIEDHSGVVDKFTGDSVMALFGAPISRGQDADNAIRTTLAVQKAMASLNKINHDLGLTGIDAGIGVHTGLVVAGNLGSSNRMNYTVIGDAVNLAARLEGLTRMYHVANVVSESTRSAAPSFVYRELDKVRVKGKNEPVRIFELMGTAEELSMQEQSDIKAFENAVKLYRQQQWQDALTAFSALNLRLCGSETYADSIYGVYINRIEQYLKSPPPTDWDAVFTFFRK